VTFTTQNPGLLLYGAIFKNFYFLTVMSITNCVFTNISFQNTPLIYDDWNATVVISSCEFRFTLFI
jgi:hypothetical protein